MKMNEGTARNLMFVLCMVLCLTLINLFEIKAESARMGKMADKLTRLEEKLPDIEPIEQKVDELTERVHVAVSRNGRAEIFRVTAYDLSYQACGKYPDHPEYGITASGERVKEWHTIAAGPELPFGTRVYLPYFRDKPNRGIFVVKDRGGAVKNGCLDVFINDYDACMEFGVKYLEAYILEEGD